MNIILGFGSTEKAFEQQECEFVADFIEKNPIEKYEIITGEFMQKLEKALNKRAEYYKAKNKEYKDATDYPERYSYYYFSVLHDASNIVIIFYFRHINRRHALSPDGWAMMCSTVPYIAIDAFSSNP